MPNLEYLKKDSSVDSGVKCRYCGKKFKSVSRGRSHACKEGKHRRRKLKRLGY